MEIIIQKDASEQRFDRFLRKWFRKYPQVRLTDIYSAIRKGTIKVNNKKVKEQYRVCEGDCIQIDESLQTGSIDIAATKDQKTRKMEKVDIQKVQEYICYEDEHRIVFNKPTGIPMHPGNKHRNDPSMNDYLEKYTTSLQSSTFKPAFGYRLDRDTSGVLIAAKTYDSLQYINQIIRERAIEKYYLTIVIGQFPKYLMIDKPLTKTYNEKFERGQMHIDEKNGVEAKTECRCEKVVYHPLLGQLSLVKIKLHTGRMHQIRIHMSDVGHPVVGDIVYGNQAVNKILYKSLNINRQLLHCWEYSFHDPYQKKRVHFTAPLPKEFETIAHLTKKK